MLPNDGVEASRVRPGALKRGGHMRLARSVFAISVIAALSWGCTREPASPRGIEASLSAAQGDFTYPKNPPRVQVDPGPVIPAAVPYCTTGPLKKPIICYSPNFVRKAYNFPSDLDGTGQT